jgi:molybdate transport system permease protein
LALAAKAPSARQNARNEVMFKSLSTSLLLAYLAFVVLILIFTARYAGFSGYAKVIRDPVTRQALILSLETSTITTVLALLVAIPGAYALSRFRLPGFRILDTIVDMPMVLPPLIMGICLMIFFSPKYSPIGQLLAAHDIRVAYRPIAIVIAQFMVAAGFTVRCLKATFDAQTPRYEQVARTLGCSAGAAFWKVTLPLAKDGILAGAVMTWARAIGEFGPIIVFASAIEGETVVLPTRIFLNMQIGELDQMAAATMMLVIIALVALLVFRRIGGQMISVSGSQ